MIPVENHNSQNPFAVGTKSKKLFKREFKRLLRNQLKNRYYNPLFDSKEERQILIKEVIFGVGKQLKLNEISLSLAIGIFDAVISKIWMSRSKMEIIAFVSLQLAVKLNGKDNVIITSCLGASNFDLFQFERIILDLLGHDLNLKTPLHVALKFLEIESLRSEIKSKLACNAAVSIFRQKLEDMHRVLTLDYDINSLTPAAIGTALVMMVRRHFGFKNLVLKELIELTQFKKSQILACYKLLLAQFQKSVKRQLEKEAELNGAPRLIDDSDFETFSFLSDSSTKKVSICF